MNNEQKLSERMRITHTLFEAKATQKPNEAIVAACEVALRKLDDDLAGAFPWQDRLREA